MARSIQLTLSLLSALAIAASGCGGHAPESRPVAATQSGAAAPQPHPDLFEHFAVLRRGRQSSDRLPRRTHIPSEVDANPALSRAIGPRDRPLRVWLVPGYQHVCVVERFVDSGAGGTSCGFTSSAGIYTAHDPIIGVIVGPFRWRPHRRILHALLPDGTRGARLLRDGRLLRRLDIRANAVIARPRRATTLSWRAPDGSRRRFALK